MGREYIEIDIPAADDCVISRKITEALGKLTGNDPVDLDFVLYDYVDSEALDAIFQTDPSGPLLVEFPVEEWSVAVYRGDSRTTIEVERDD